MARAGKFEIEVTDPYPSWVRITYADVEILRNVHHKELSDLEYCVRQAMRDARLLLKNDATEV
jgi:hypothetical protein